MSYHDIPPLRELISANVVKRTDERVVRVISAKLATGTSKPHRVFVLDCGPLGQKISVGQFALVAEEELVGKHLIACCNVKGTMEIGDHVSEVWLKGTDHPDSPVDEAQALPIYAHEMSLPGQRTY